jgi:hypothetical protein
MITWKPMDTAPKDGTTVRIPLRFPLGVRAYWDDDLKTWVLAHPLHIESIRDPDYWSPE